jgi:hypothetical protein
MTPLTVAVLRQPDCAQAQWTKVQGLNARSIGSSRGSIHQTGRNQLPTSFGRSPCGHAANMSPWNSLLSVSSAPGASAADAQGDRAAKKTQNLTTPVQMFRNSSHGGSIYRVGGNLSADLTAGYGAVSEVGAVPEGMARYSRLPPDSAACVSSLQYGFCQGLRGVIFTDSRPMFFTRC